MTSKKPSLGAEDKEKDAGSNKRSASRQRASAAKEEKSVHQNDDDHDGASSPSDDADMDEAPDVDELDDVAALDLSGDALYDGDGNLPAVTAETPGALTLFTHNPPERTRDSLHLYLREINKFPLLQPDEEVEMAQRVRDTGDADAAFRLISSHLRLVVRIAMDFQRKWMQNVLDLVQEGNVGLVRAVSKFDPDKGIKFSYYATFWIKAYILKFIMDNWRLVKIGTTQTQRKLFYNLNKERQQLVAQGYDPDAATLAERLNVTEEQIIEMEQRLDTSDMSLDAPVGEEGTGSATRMDYLPALGPGIEETLANSEVGEMVRERLKSLEPKLSDKELYILHHRLLSEEPVTLREIGEHFSITRERVRQIEARLLQKIRDHLFSKIKDFSRDWIEQE